jgi:hypothetical protein
MVKENNNIIDDFSEEDKAEINQNFWKLEENPEIIGLFKEWANDSFGQHAIITTNEGEIHLPNLMALNSKLQNKDIKENQKIKIVYLGEKKSEKTGRMYKDFDLYVKN